MNTVEPSNDSFAAITSIDYDPGGSLITRDSPILKAKKLKLSISPSPPPPEPKVGRPRPSGQRSSSNRRRNKAIPSRGDAILLQVMAGGRNPEIAQFAVEQPLSDSEDEDDEDEDDEDDEDEDEGEGEGEDEDEDEDEIEGECEDDEDDLEDDGDDSNRVQEQGDGQGTVQNGEDDGDDNGSGVTMADVGMQQGEDEVQDEAQEAEAQDMVQDMAPDEVQNETHHAWAWDRGRTQVAEHGRSSAPDGNRDRNLDPDRDWRRRHPPGPPPSPPQGHPHGHDRDFHRSEHPDTVPPNHARPGAADERSPSQFGPPRLPSDTPKDQDGDSVMLDDVMLPPPRLDPGRHYSPHSQPYSQQRRPLRPSTGASSDHATLAARSGADAVPLPHFKRDRSGSLKSVAQGALRLDEKNPSSAPFDRQAYHATVVFAPPSDAQTPQPSDASQLHTPASLVGLVRSENRSIASTSGSSSHATPSSIYSHSDCAASPFSPASGGGATGLAPPSQQVQASFSLRKQDDYHRLPPLQHPTTSAGSPMDRSASLPPIQSLEPLLRADITTSSRPVASSAASLAGPSDSADGSSINSSHLQHNLPPIGYILDPLKAHDNKHTHARGQDPSSLSHTRDFPGSRHLPPPDSSEGTFKASSGQQSYYSTLSGGGLASGGSDAPHSPVSEGHRYHTPAPPPPPPPPPPPGRGLPNPPREHRAHPFLAPASPPPVPPPPLPVGHEASRLGNPSASGSPAANVIPPRRLPPPTGLRAIENQQQQKQLRPSQPPPPQLLQPPKLSSLQPQPPPLQPLRPQQNLALQQRPTATAAASALAPARPPSQTQSRTEKATTTPTPEPTTSGTYKCTEPGCTAKPFLTQYLLNSHANVHSTARPHYCPVVTCPRHEYGFKRKNEMIRHGLVHTSPGYVCPFCAEREHKYPRPDNLLRHVRAHHKDTDRDDKRLQDVLEQRPPGPSGGQRRRRRQQQR